MKPNYVEVSRILMLALRCWTDFLNEMNSPLLSKSHLPDEEFFGKFYEENPHDEIREALILIGIYWDRISEEQLRLGMIGLRFSKPHTVFGTTLIRASDDKACFNFVAESTRRIDEIENPIKFAGRFNFPTIQISLDNPSWRQRVIQKYDMEMLVLRTHPDPYVRAGIDLQLIQRGFKL